MPMGEKFLILAEILNIMKIIPSSHKTPHCHIVVELVNKYQRSIVSRKSGHCGLVFQWDNIITLSRVFTVRSQYATYTDITFDVARILNANKQNLETNT